MIKYAVNTMKYPLFVEINRRHKKTIDSITHEFPPYCDFQFSNLLSWSSHKNPTKFSEFNGNLVVEMKEYSTNHVITMFMGKHNVAESLKEILKQHVIIERVPEEVITEINRSPLKGYFEISEDINNYDYILDLESVANPSGNKLKSKRQSAKAFERNYSTHVVRFAHPDYKKLLPLFEAFFEEIAKEKGKGFETLIDEFEAVDKLLKNQNLFSLPILLVEYGGRLIGFTINEIMNGKKSETALGCFGKGLREYKGIYAYLEVITARYLLGKKIKYINLEEDMGFKGLRESKRMWRPVTVLKKYIVKRAIEI